MIFCFKCKQDKNEDEFWIARNRDTGRWPYCKPCARSYTARERDDSHLEIPTHRTCNACDQELPLTGEYFTRARSRRFGFEYMCKSCRREKRMRRYYEAPEAENIRHIRIVANGPVEKITLADLYDRDNGVCALCAESVDRTLGSRHPQSGSIDHILPISKGGTHTWANVQLAHLFCNMSKGNRAA